jgi:MFS transporter, Spinster family, sphingosine-1-phosphate transporter
MNRLAFLLEPRWRVAGFLVMAGAFNYADRAAMSSVLSPLRTELGLSDVALGMLGSVFLWSYAVCSPLAGGLADRWSRRRVVIGSLFVWSVVMVVTGFAGGFTSLLALRIALGIAESIYLPAATALLADHHSPATRGRAMSLHSVGLNCGVVLGGAAAGYLAEHFGWRTGFWVLGGLGIVLALGARPLMSDPPVTAQRTTRASVAETLRYLARVPSYHMLLVKGVLAGVGVWTFLNWLPLYLKDAYNMKLGAAGFAGTFMLQIATVLGIAGGGWLSDRVAATDARRRMLLQGLSYLVAAPFLWLFLAQPGFTVVAIAVSAFSLFRGLGQSNENPVVCEVVPGPFRSTAIGIMNTCSTAAGGLGVLLAGILKQSFGLNAVFAGISVLFLISGAALILAYRVWTDRDIARARAYVGRPVSSRASAAESSSASAEKA